MSKIDVLIEQAKRIVYDAPQSDTLVKIGKYTEKELVDMLNEIIYAFEQLYDTLEDM